jgi:hypothetical protein
MERIAVRATLLAALTLCMVPSFAAPQSLGDAARRQAGKRSSQAPTTKSFTDADLRALGNSREERAPSGSAVTAEPAAVVPVAATSQRTDEAALRAALDREAAARSRQEASWRQLASAAQARLAAARRQHDAVCGPGVLLGG